MDWKEKLNETSRNLATFRAADPASGKAFTGMHQAAMGEGALTVREKELIALGIGIARQCVDCIGFHVQAAAKHGASRQDIAECISVSIYMGGGPAFMYGVMALEAYDQLCSDPLRN